MIIDLRNNYIKHSERNLKIHRPLSTSFKEIEVLKDGRILIIEDYYEYHFENRSNFYCLNRTLEVDWFSPCPNEGFEKEDFYVGFTSIGDKIFANSWVGFRVEIDVQTGNIKSVEFTK